MANLDWQAGRAPHLGEHNRYVLGELLALSKEEIAALEREGVTSATLEMPIHQQGHMDHVPRSVDSRRAICSSKT